MDAPNGGSPLVRDGTVSFSYRDPEPVLAGVRLAQERALTVPGRSLDFRHVGTGWELRLPRPAVSRMEYRLELIDHRGEPRLACDPANPLRARGPFGEMSVVEFPEYDPPRWLTERRRPAGRVVPFTLSTPRLRHPLPGRLWSSPGTGRREPLPLLIVHDGPEYADYSSLFALLDAMCAQDELPPMRAALLAPGDRNGHYSASPRYARSFALDVVPGLSVIAPFPEGRHMRVGMGTSLGALAMLHAHRCFPEVVGGLFLQSGSFFRAGTREARWDFTSDGRIVRFVGDVHAARTTQRQAIPVAMTCGRLEENLECNRALLRSLRAQGYDVRLDETADLHNWVAWRDALDPHLVALLQRLWG